MDKHQKIYDWVKTYPPLADILYFNTVQEMAELSGINTVYSDDIAKEYTSGLAKKEYLFALVQMKDYDSDGYSTINLEALEDAEKFAMWVKEQNKNRNFPQFGDVQKVEVVQNATLASADDGIAKYMIQILITYMEEK